MADQRPLSDTNDTASARDSQVRRIDLLALPGRMAVLRAAPWRRRRWLAGRDPAEHPLGGVPGAHRSARAHAGRDHAKEHERGDGRERDRISAIARSFPVGRPVAHRARDSGRHQAFQGCPPVARGPFSQRRGRRDRAASSPSRFFFVPRQACEDREHRRQAVSLVCNAVSMPSRIRCSRAARLITHSRLVPGVSQDQVLPAAEVSIDATRDPFPALSTRASVA